EQVPIENGVKTKHEIRMQEQLYCEANILWKNK
ncbi:acyl-[acyl-carrier-protein] thioesterase, partial [Enterococcus faecalis]|nr:acyl-[acyl-carrier-protein] thioesterase [Enterococcus faecalis]